MAKKKKSKSGLFITLGIILVLGALVAYIVISKKQEGLKVQISKVEKQTIKQIVTATGRIQPETEVKVSSETSGEIVFLGVKEGDTVSKNQILVRIKPDIIQTQLEQQKAMVEASEKSIDIYKAELERIEKDYKRMGDLLKKQYVSQKEFDAIESQYKTAKLNIETANSRYRQSLASMEQVKKDAIRTTITAPIDGIVTKLNVELGEKVVGTGMMAGTELMIVADMNVMNAEVSVDENDIVMVELGDTTAVEIDAFPERIFKGTVFEIGHSANQSAMGTQDQVTNFLVKVRLLDVEGRMRPGMSCNADIETEIKYDVMSVPLQSVTVRDDKIEETQNTNEDFRGKKKVKKIDKDNTNKKNKPQTCVFIFENGKAKKIDVETGVSDKGSIEIISGLDLDDEVISGPFSAVNKELKGGEEVVVDTNFYKFQKY